MIIGIISDSHDNIWNLKKVLNDVQKNKIQLLIHCGDLSAPFILKDLDILGIPVHCVFGNVDSDRFEMTKLVYTQLKNIILHGDIAELEIDGVKIAVNHYPHFAEALALSGKYDVVFYGHTHLIDNRKVGNCLLLNPGEVMGRKGSVTYATFDTEMRVANLHSIT